MHRTTALERIKLYKIANPSLDTESIGILLAIDELYKDEPSDISEFRRVYAHLDPGIISRTSEGVTFLSIARSKEPLSIIRHRLNTYINVKYNHLDNFQQYDKNMKRFKDDSITISRILDQILQTSNFPKEIIDTLREKEQVRMCYDFFELLELYKKTKLRRVKFEIMRKIGLIVLLSRIRRTFFIDDLDLDLSEVKHILHKGLGLDKKTKDQIYTWIDEKDVLRYSSRKKEAVEMHRLASEIRKAHAKPVYPLQVFEHNPYKTRFGSRIVHIELRNKFRANNEISYTSFIEKVIRKNLQFPNLVHDVIGVKIIVRDEDEIPQLITDLETFLGGASTRKREKNSLNKFGKKKLGIYSSDQYFVWKAVYDIAVPHPNVREIQKMMAVARNDRHVMDALRKRLRYFKARPQDVIVELQLQDLESYLMNMTKGCAAEHSVLKTIQVRANSFHKLFPKEIYMPSLNLLRKKLLKQ